MPGKKIVGGGWKKFLVLHTGSRLEMM